MVEIDRRTIGRAVIAVPVISVATAAPAYAASPAPSCPTCLTTGGGAFTEQIVVAGGRSTVATAGTLAFNLSSTTCDLSLFQPAYTVVGLSASVTYNTGATQTFGVAATTGAGTFGQVSAFTTAFSAPTSSIAMPNDAVPPYGPVSPTSISVSFTAIFVGLPSLIQISCPYTVTFRLTTANTGTVALGVGTVNYTGTASNGTITGG